MSSETKLADAAPPRTTEPDASLLSRDFIRTEVHAFPPAALMNPDVPIWALINWLEEGERP